MKYIHQDKSNAEFGSSRFAGPCGGISCTRVGTVSEGTVVEGVDCPPNGMVILTEFTESAFAVSFLATKTSA